MCVEKPQCFLSLEVHILIDLDASGPGGRDPAFCTSSLTDLDMGSQGPHGACSGGQMRGTGAGRSQVRGAARVGVQPSRALPRWRPGTRQSQSLPGELAPGSTQCLQEPLGWRQLPMSSWPQGVLNTRLFYPWCKVMAQHGHMWRQMYLQRVGPDLNSLNASL